MKIEELFDEWSKDSEIDKTELSDEALKIPKLHHKYYQLFVIERQKLRKFEYDFKQLKLEKYEFFSQGPNEVSQKYGWELPTKGIILKSDIPMYMEADKDLIQLSLKIGLQLEKVEFLESILKTLNNRGYLIKSAIDFIKFTNGV